MEQSVQRDHRHDYPFPMGPLGTPPRIIALARKYRPLCPIRLPSGHNAWMITRKDDIHAVLTDRRFSRNLTYPGGPRFLGEDFNTLPGGIFNLDPPDHTRIRHVLQRFYTREGVAQHTASITRMADELLDKMAKGPNPTDLVQAYSAPLPLAISSEILRVPVQLRQRYAQCFRSQTNFAASSEEIATGIQAILRFCRDVVRSKQDELNPDEPIGALIAAHLEAVISEDELISTIAYLFVTGSDPLISPLGTGVLTLLAHPDQLRLCLDDASLWPKAVEEVLRYHHNGVLGMPRVALEDVEMHGVTIKKGEAVCATMLGATWDPRHYRNPEKFNILRETDGTATFGAGPHFCLGATLARVFLRIAYERLFTRFPTLSLAVPADDVPWEPDIIFTRPACLPVVW
ncbi:cytochrome P450 [Brucella intermedia]|uniref:cytochrome P450 n=1 Tax=Brucella intermedia TaxID=94625 RepID=UPI00124BF0D1|nr:cytochrome P450 [Brucella intermedia]KAB2722419.1 cytochrome P450 [Brucella intermedia]